MVVAMGVPFEIVLVKGEAEKKVNLLLTPVIKRKEVEMWECFGFAILPSVTVSRNHENPIYKQMR